MLWAWEYENKCRKELHCPSTCTHQHFPPVGALTKWHCKAPPPYLTLWVMAQYWKSPSCDLGTPPWSWRSAMFPCLIQSLLPSNDKLGNLHSTQLDSVWRSSSGFFFPKLWGRWVHDHPKEYLAKMCLQVTEESRKVLESCYMLATC